MSLQQHVLINSNGNNANNGTLQQYLTNNNLITNGADQNGIGNVRVQLVKQEQTQQRYILNRQFIQNPQQHQSQQQHHQQTPIQIQQAHLVHQDQTYWLIVEIESNNEINSYAFVESKDVIGNPPLETLTTGKLVIVNINNKQIRATVVMASSK